jgi:hypothetical protein
LRVDVRQIANLGSPEYAHGGEKLEGPNPSFLLRATKKCPEVMI